MTDLNAPLDPTERDAQAWRMLTERLDMAGIDVYWFVRRVVSPDVWRAYEEAQAPLWRAYEEAQAPLWRAYEEAEAPLLADALRAVESSQEAA